MKKSLVFIPGFINVIGINCCTCGTEKLLLKAFGIEKTDIVEHFKFKIKKEAENVFVHDLSEEVVENQEKKGNEIIKNGGCVVEYIDCKKVQMFYLKCSKDKLKINEELITKSTNILRPNSENKFFAVFYTNCTGEPDDYYIIKNS